MRTFAWHIHRRAATHRKKKQCDPSSIIFCVGPVVFFLTMGRLSRRVILYCTVCMHLQSYPYFVGTSAASSHLHLPATCRERPSGRPTPFRFTVGFWNCPCAEREPCSLCHVQVQPSAQIRAKSHVDARTVSLYARTQPWPARICRARLRERHTEK